MMNIKRIKILSGNLQHKYIFGIDYSNGKDYSCETYCNITKKGIKVIITRIIK